MLKLALLKAWPGRAISYRFLLPLPPLQHSSRKHSKRRSQLSELELRKNPEAYIQAIIPWMALFCIPKAGSLDSPDPQHTLQALFIPPSSLRGSVGPIFTWEKMSGGKRGQQWKMSTPCPHPQDDLWVSLAGGIDPLVRGLLAKKSKLMNQDKMMTGELRNKLFQPTHKIHGFDLAAINIQRCRDHGMPGEWAGVGPGLGTF